jgi:maltokinase
MTSQDSFRTGSGASAALVSSLASGGPLPPGLRVQAMTPLPVLTDTAERGITVDQTNESVIVGERLVVKWFPVSSSSPAPRLLAHLAEVGFTRMPIPYAAVWRSDRLVALVAAYLPAAYDGWDWCVDDVLAYWDGGELPGFPADVGRLAAELHAALATPSSVFPAPVASAEVDMWQAQAAATVDAAVAETADRWLASIAARLRDDVAVRAGGPTPVLPIHGDLHAGQILRWRGGLAVTDFDGNPAVGTAGQPQPAARDVAQLLTSLEHVAQVADKRTAFTRSSSARAFAAHANEECLGAYRARLDALGCRELLDDRLLRPFAVEQECRELIYAARFLPRWAYAPMNVLRSWYAAEG